MLLRWAVQQGVATIPGTGNPAHMRENLEIFDFELPANVVDVLSAQGPVANPREPPGALTFQKYIRGMRDVQLRNDGDSSKGGYFLMDQYTASAAEPGVVPKAFANKTGSMVPTEARANHFGHVPDAIV